MQLGKLTDNSVTQSYVSYLSLAKQLSVLSNKN